MTTPGKSTDTNLPIQTQKLGKVKPIAPESRSSVQYQHQHQHQQQQQQPALEKEPQDMIVQTPDDDDVLLGQGHYRWPGNKKLNQLVDAKVDEYKKQSRVFKTYMAHDIINKMRSKGVRFLKELAPQGWIVVKDDKEAREKVAQRFQYMMRKQAEAAKMAAKAVAAKDESKPKAATSAPRPVLMWNGVSVKVPFLPVFHQLQKSSVLVNDDIHEIPSRLVECFEMIGVQSSFNYEEATSILTTKDNLKMQLNLWKPLGGNRGVIVELHNLEGDMLALQKYNRYILEASTGFFDRYKHNLFLTAASVKDQVTAFTTTGTRTTCKQGSEKGREQLPATVNTKTGMSKTFNERALQHSKRKQLAARGEPLEYIARGLPLKRFDHNGAVPMVSRESKLVPIAPRPPPPTKLVPLVPRVVPPPPSHKEQESNNGGLGATTGSFASAFSRWETGSEGSDLSMTRAARRQSLTTGKSYQTESWNQSPGAARQRGFKSVDTTQSPSASMPSSSGDHGREGGNVTFHSSSTRERHEEPRNAPVSAAKAPWVPSSGQNAGFAATSRTAPTSFSHYSSRQEPSINFEYNPQPSSVAANKPGHENEDIEGGVDRHLDCSAETQDWKTPAFDRWSSAVGGPSAEETKCEGPLDEKLDAEMTCVDHTIETIKRLSLSSSDASIIDSRTNIGRIRRALSNQEMKCDSSFDDEPYEGGDMLFIPSSFFGGPAQNGNPLRRAPNPPSPAHSFSSHISVEMRSLPSPSPSSSSHVSIEFSLPSPCGSFNSRCSLEVNSLKHARMDEALSPSVFQLDPSNQGIAGLGAFSDSRSQQNSVPPAIFVDSSSNISGQHF